MYAEVAIPVYIRQTFTYRLPELFAHKAWPGCRLIVPFGKKLITGYIVALHNKLDKSLEAIDLKDAEELVDEEPILTNEILELTHWVAEYYLAPWGEVIKGALPTGINAPEEVYLSITEAGREALSAVPPSRLNSSSKWQALNIIATEGMINTRDLQKTFSKARVSALSRDLSDAGHISVVRQMGSITSKPKMQNAVRLVQMPSADGKGKALSAQQKKVIDELFESNEPMALAALTDRTAVSISVIRTLEKRGLVEVFAREVRRDPLSHIRSNENQNTGSQIRLTETQAEILGKIESQLETGEYSTFLLHGVTGSGKTEVYIRAMRAALNAGKSALMLVPEISLTPMFSRRLEEHFGDQVAILHSALSDGERLDEWNRIRLGEARVVIGTRSAVFAPLENIGLVVVDEEHESSYKQDETPRYHGRDTAIMRALKANAVVILGSATPSIESYHNAHQEKYIYCRMAERIGARGLADVEIVDMREVFKRHGKQQFLSDELKQGLFDTRSRGQQAMVLLNRRGFSSFLLCRSCGNAVQCPNCDVTLTYHRKVQRLVCHYCNHQRGIPPKCPVCDGEFIYYVGEGTEQLEAVIKENFPAMTVARLDRDTTRKRGAYEKIITEFASGQVDVLVGTQMIAKGHDFPNVTLVGVVSVDAGLAMPDFRAAERTFQLLTQVAGRAGRGDVKGRVLIQTYHPLHYALQHACKQDYEGFYQEEIRFRRSMFYPPFTALINVLVRNADYGKAQAQAAEMARLIRNSTNDRLLRILGPAPAPLTRLRGEYRMQVLIKGPNRSSVRRALDLAMQTAIETGHDMKQVMVEVDPINLM